MSIIISDKENCEKLATFVQCFSLSSHNLNAWCIYYPLVLTNRSNILKTALAIKKPTSIIKNFIRLMTIYYEPYHYLLIERILKITLDISRLCDIDPIHSDGCHGLLRKSLQMSIYNEVECILNLSSRDIINCTKVLTNMVRERRLNITCAKFIIVYMFRSINSHTSMDYIFSFFEDMVYKRK